jgi:hypothetical protein
VIEDVDEVCFGGGQRGKNAEGESGEDGDAKRKQQNARIERRFVKARDVPRIQAQQQANGSVSEPDAECSADRAVRVDVLLWAWLARFAFAGGED